jgi:hypothetical protein
MLKRALVVACVLAVSACTSQPVLNVTGEPVIVAAGSTATSENVRDAIVRAGAGLGWHMQSAAPGVVHGTITLRAHSADIDVRYNAKSFDIVYVSSSNLNAAGGQIHRNYNGWIENLDRAIRHELLRI